MTNIFVEKFKKIVTDYFNDVSALRAKAKYNSVTFKPTIAKDYNASLEEEITHKGNQAFPRLIRYSPMSNRESAFVISQMREISVMIALLNLEFSQQKKSMFF